MNKLIPLLIAFMLLTACQQAQVGSSPAVPTPTLPLSGPETTPTLPLSGPETTPNVPRPYPSSLTVETAAQGIAAVVDAPPSITGLAEVQLILAKHTQLVQAAGLSFHHLAVKYVAADQRWFLVPVQYEGTIAGWLEIADPTSQSGWRFGEQPTWDLRYHPSTDTYQYGLPALHDAANHFEVGFENGFPVLIEVTPTGTAQYWNNIVEKSMMLVEGAVLPTETPTATPEHLPAEDRWQVSPDGHIVYNEAQLYDGLFTINKEHPEYTEKYWKDTIRGLWNLNSVGKNTVFLSQFPTADSLVKYLQDGGGPVRNLWIPVIYPDRRRQFWYYATLEPVEGPIDLTQIAIAIYKPTREEIYHYSPSYATGTKYVSYFGAKGEVLVEKVDVNGKNILKFTLREDLLMDSTNIIFQDGTEGTFPAITVEKTPKENLLAATALLRFWPIIMQTRDDPNTGIRAWMPEWDPPALSFVLPGASAQVLKEITTLDGTPLIIR